MSPFGKLIASILVLMVAASVRAQADLRVRYGAEKIETAKLIDEGMRHAGERRFKDARQKFEKAIEIEPACQIAHFQLALTCSDLGDIEEAIKAYRNCLSDSVRRTPSTSATAAVNVGIVYCKLKEHDDGNFFLTRAILEDPDNAHGQRGKAYRNMAISLSQQERHFGAALALSLAYEDKAPNITMEMLREFFRKGDKHEAGIVMHFGEKQPTLPKRDGPGTLTPVALDPPIGENVSEIFADPARGSMIALVANQPHYYVVDLKGKPKVAKVTVGDPIACGCFVEGALYLVTKAPAKLVKVDAPTGKSLESIDLKSHSPTSIAVFPSQGRAYFPSGDKVIHEFNLATRTVKETNVPGQVVAGHPNQRDLFSFIRPNPQAPNHIIVNGRPLMIGGMTSNLQTILFKSSVTRTGLLLAGARDNAASNGGRLVISPDGHWVGIAGGGGWKTTLKEHGFGYGVAVFSTANLEHVQGFFKTDAYPRGLAINPVTGQVFAFREPSGRLYHLTNNSAATDLTAKFTGASAWSGDGKYLMVGVDKGAALFENKLTAAEQQAGTGWHKTIAVAKVAPATSPAAKAFAFAPIAALKSFAVASEPARADVEKGFAKALSDGRAARPGPWADLDAYAKDRESTALFDEVAGASGSESIGFAIFKLKRGLKANPNSVPTKFYLAEALSRNNQTDDAEPLLLDVVRADQGRTELTTIALNRLADHFAAKKKPLAALQCLATALEADRGNPQAIKHATALLESNKFAAESKHLAKLAAEAPIASGAIAASAGTLPRLPPPGALKKLASDELYQRAVTAVALVKTNSGSGSGVCVGTNEYVLTNEHVVGNQDRVQVYTYTLKDKAAVRMPVATGTVVYRSARDDVAVLKLDRPLEHLTPAPVALKNPRAGEKVYAIGSPGFGNDVLELSISEGLVSSSNRKIDDVPFVQHSAAVNPGNSGGPLYDDTGRVVGIVTRKARLENVSFAIPIETIRAIFAKGG